MIFRHNGWTGVFDDETGNLTCLKKGNLIALDQTFPMLTLTVNGVSAHNDQQQMHNLEMCETVGANAALIGAEDGENGPVVTLNLGDGYRAECIYEFLDEWVRMRVRLSYTENEHSRLRWINWDTGIPYVAGELFAPGYTPTRKEPFDLHRRIKDYRHSDVLTHDLFGEHVPAYRPGFLGAYLPEDSLCACTWFVSEMFPCFTPALTHSDLLVRHAEIHCARRMKKGDTQTVGDFFFTVMEGSRTDCIRRLTASYKPYGWAQNRKNSDDIRIMELHLGVKSDRKLFDNFTQVRQALPEIRRLGFNAIEVMPNMPFPSYSVYDLASIRDTYGDEPGLIEMSKEAHRLGMKVILDMVFHGPREFDAELTTPRSYYLDAHPDWFMRHESGEYARTYTRSFDMGNPDYIAHIGDCMELLIEKTGADGFRLDAQMWSETPNWDPKCPRHPYESVLAGMRMMDVIAPRIHAKYPDILFYTEANGPYSGKGHELRYNYDCHWMYPGLCPVIDRRGAPIHVLNYASMNTLSWPDAAMWLTEMQLTSPEGLTIVFQTDSHDSCEWGGYPGGQYNREAYGSDVHRALYALVNCLKGGLMSFYGAQEGNEDFYADLAAALKAHPAMQGTCSYTAVTSDDPKTALILWTRGGDRLLAVINLENRSKQIHTSEGADISLAPCEVKLLS